MSCTKLLKVAAALAAACLPIGSQAAVTFAGNSGNLSASVTFGVSGQNLTVTLANTSTHDVLVPADVLTAVFFDMDSQVKLIPVSAALNSSTVWFGSNGGGNVGGEWAYASGISATAATLADAMFPTKASPLATDSPSARPGFGISSSGLGLFGPANRFPGSNLQGPDSPDGLQYGITSPGDNIATGNSAVTGANALIHSSVVFTFSFTGDLSEDAFRNVMFQYGTSLSEPHFGGTPVPEPTTLIAGGLLLLPFGLSTLQLLRRRKS